MGANTEMIAGQMSRAGEGLYRPGQLVNTVWVQRRRLDRRHAPQMPLVKAGPVQPNPAGRIGGRRAATRAGLRLDPQPVKRGAEAFASMPTPAIQ